MLSKTTLSCVAASLLVAQAVAWAASNQPPPPPPPPPPCASSKSCAPTEFVAEAKAICPPLNPKALFCEKPADPPPYSEVSCSNFSGGVACEAFPQSAGNLHYAWSSTPALHLDYTPSADDSMVFFNCAYGAHGMVTVTIISPTFASTTVQTGAMCGDL